MTEISYFWDNYNGAIGDYAATYSDDLFALYLDLLFNYDRRVPLIAFQEYGTYSDPVDANGGNFRVFACCALVDGRVYINDATLTLAPASGNGYYAIVLRRDDSGGAGDQTVRAALIYDAGGAPTPTQTAATWECVVAQGQVVAGVAQIDSYLWRPFPHNMVLPFRGGVSETDWSLADTTLDWRLYPTYRPIIQAGVKAHTAATAEADINVSFPIPFKVGTFPLVFVTLYNLSGSTPSHSYIPVITKVSSFGFTVNLDTDANVEGFHWIAIGEDNDEL